MSIALQALSYVSEGDVVGLGTGRAATAFIEALAASGRKAVGIATSAASAELAGRLGIRLSSLAEFAEIAVTVDGADEIDPLGNAIKGYGAALVREKIVAAASRKLVLLVGEEKLVPVLGSRGKLPIEVLPFGMTATARHLQAIGLSSQPRASGAGLLVTDNGHHILDCQTGPIDRPAELEAKILAIPGVVGTGLFLGMADVVLVQRGAQVEVREPRKDR